MFQKIIIIIVTAVATLKLTIHIAHEVAFCCEGEDNMLEFVSADLPSPE
jgi:hypothetical protein